MEKKIDEEIYKINIEGNLREIKIATFFKFLNLSEEMYEMFSLGISYENIPLPEFIYALLSFFNEHEELKEELSLTSKNRLFKLEQMQVVDCEAINKHQETINPYIGQYKINHELEKELDLVMEKGNSPFQKFCLVYKEVCERFSYDEKYYIEENAALSRHSDINYIEQITFQDKIVCYEVILILAYYLEKLGFNYELCNGNTYGLHTYIKMRFDEYLIKIEPVDTVFHDDLTNAKIGTTLIGLTCLNKNMATRDRFKTLLSFYYQESKINYYDGMLPSNKIDCSIDLPSAIKEGLILVDLAISKVKEKNLEVMEKMCFLAHLLARYKFSSQLSVFTNEFIKDETSPYGFSALIILGDLLYGTYYVLYNFQDIKVLSQEEVQNLFFENVFSDIREKRKTFGIKR